MDGFTDRWMNKCMDGWTDGEGMVGQTDEWMVGMTYGCIAGWLDGWRDGCKH